MTERGHNAKMKRLLTCLGVIVTILLLLGAGLAGGILLDRRVLPKYVPPDDVPVDAAADFQLMADAWNTIDESYVDRIAVEAQALTYAAIGGMVDALGDTGRSRFLSPEMVQERHDFTSGQLESIGAYVEMKDGRVVWQSGWTTGKLS